jgi:hypothetical protein
MSGAKNNMDHITGTGTTKTLSDRKARGIDLDEGMSPALQAHIGRHVRAAFDEVAQEPIPEHLLRLLKDLDRSGDK